MIREAWGRFVGPEATRLDHALTATTTAGGALMAAAVARGRGGGRAATAASAVLAADLVGGAYVNNTLACSRWYARPGQGDREHLTFAAWHVHPALVAWLDRGRSGPVPGPLWAALHHGYLMGATLAIRRFPRRRRTLGVALTAGGLALDQAIGRSRLVPWFAWTYYPKLLMGHAAAALWSDRRLAEPRVGVSPGRPGPSRTRG
ncbi:hypothetical protein [Georgenia sp. Z1491]|uniref:hypothetical protein n=1 Tax=Georgenia sp. Z1491 TaxID=3416707 RepID=UPI003CED73C2